MIKPNPTVVKETKYIAVWIGIFSVMMQAVFLLIGSWDFTVLLGNLWGSSVMILNFFLMGLSIQKAVGQEESDARKTMKNSQTLRTLFLFVWVLIGAVLPCFSTIATIIPLFFPRIAIALRPLMKEKETTKEVSVQDEIK